MTTTTSSDIDFRERKARHPIIAFARTQPTGMAGLVFIIVLFIAGVFADFVAPYDPLQLDYGAMLAPPSWEHWMGTDAFGRDVFSRIIYGARTALAVGFLSSMLGSSIGAIIGMISAYYGGRIDMTIERLMDVLLAFPIIVLALAVVVRSATLAIRGLPYIDAARAAGYSSTRIIFRHIAPNVVAPFLIMFTAFIAQAILLEASLSFLGLGVTEPTAAWGLMLSGTSQEFYSQAPWMILFPGIAISLAVFAFNLFGDSLRDYLDPRFKV